MQELTSDRQASVWLLSDTHLIADSLHDDGSAFQRMKDTSAGKDLVYQELALKAFVRKVVAAKPTAVVITGDLTFNGAKASAEKLAEIFKPLTDQQIAFLVLPGNHDIYDGWARKFSGATEIRVDEISQEAWKEIFADSYQVAYHQDSSSLAYSVNLNQDYRLIMADSNIYGDRYSLTHPITNGRIPSAELAWIENELKDAQRQQKHVLFFMHHNLYQHNDVVHGGYVLDNAEEVQALFKKYQVQAVFSGHIHAPNITGPEKNCPSVEVASSCFAMTDQGYGVISLTPSELTYQHYSFDAMPCLTDEEKEKIPAADFRTYLRAVFNESNEKMLAKSVNRFATPHDLQLAQQLINRLHWNFFTGHSFYSAEQKAEFFHSPGYQVLTTAMPELKNYLQSLLDVDQDSQQVKIQFND
ncbi:MULTISPECIES: metallophosphoesterase [Lactobacillus]|uniref:Serine/threonine protein phosphatase n=1 Tax=Lactobacillus xujianguonis TaxID=2495899 RepID=A0A437SU56_9LACO|nr:MULTISPECIES: metallophosphoesterase [Lactobacillus]RVU70468.1 serine/threonine protein phosphatase [Lactobacillus xujianguonis]RVU76862.1 serine/threonine protein phosphatase [Lactobacillus xujianguonis]